MNENKIEANYSLVIINNSTIILLFVAMLPLPYSFYIFLRWFILLSALEHIRLSILQHRFSVLPIFIIIGLIFNPFHFIYLSKGIWCMIDLFSALFVKIGGEEINKQSKVNNSK